MDPKPELTSLPDVPSRAIVSLLPLQQVISTLPRLHSRFNPIRESVLKSNQRLVLYIGNLKQIQKKKYWSQLGVPFASHLVDSNGRLLSPDTSFHRLHLLTLSQPSVEQLSTLMPNLTYLEVAIASVDISVIPHLITLLTFWGPSLQTLKLLIREFVSPNEEHLQRTYLPTVASHLRNLIGQINTELLALENLSLDLDDAFFDRYKEGLDQKVLYALGDVRRFQNENANVLNGPQIQANDDPVRKFNLLIQEVSDFLNQEPSPEAVNYEEVLAQEEVIRWQLREKHRFTSDILLKGENEAILNLSILGQLKEFSFDTGRESSSMQASILKTLEKYGSNRLTSIFIAGEAWNLPAFAGSRFASRFTRFPHPRAHDDTPFLHVFTNLQVYSLNWSDLGPNQMARLRALASLPNLQCLNLHGFSKDTPFLKADFAKLPPFRSVTALKIFIFNHRCNPYQTHVCFQAPYWAHLFPAVQIIKLLHGCNLCMACFPVVRMESNWEQGSYETVLTCVKSLLAPLRELPSLRKIFYHHYGWMHAIAEFTPEGELAQTHEFVY